MLPDGKVVSLSKKDYGFTHSYIHYKSYKSLKIISDDWSSRLFGIFMTQQCVEFNLTSVATSKYDKWNV